MTNLFFDIETLPSSEEDKELHLEILRKKHKGKTDTQIHEWTSFDGTFGRICCIAVIKEVDGKEVLHEVFSGDEKEILRKFWEASQDVHRFVGHNVLEFDFPFIYQRSIILGVKPRSNISFARYKDTPVFDTMRQWTLWSYDKTVSLDTLSKVLGFPTSKDKMDGSEVWSYYKEGKLKEICEYCMKDVELTRQVYKKMVFEDSAQNSPNDDLPF